MTTRLVLVRHGQSVWNASRRWQGHADAPLSELGRDQAKETARRLAGETFEALYASDLRRATETARIVGAPHGRVPVVDRRLRELDIGEWEGLSREQIAARWPEELERFDADEPGARAPGGETRSELQARVFAALDDLTGRHGGGPLLVVAHGGVLAAILGWFGHENGEAVPCDWPL